LYVGGSGPGNYSNIQDAIDNVSEGDIVFVYRGFYQENILIHTSIQLIGQENTTTIIDGGTVGTVVSISTDNTLLQGFTIQNAKDDVRSAGIEISVAKNVIIMGNIIQENKGLGINLKGPELSNVTIIGNTIRNNSYGLYLFNDLHTCISMNTFNNNGEGIYVLHSYASTIRNNSICANRGLGIHLESTSNVVVNGNSVTTNANGIYTFNSSEITFVNNTIGWNRWYGLWTQNCSNNMITNNDILANVDVGLFLESSYDTTISTNALLDNDNGVYLKNSAGNLITNNNLRNMKVNGCFVAHSLIHRRNIWESNYWERARLFPYPIFGNIKLENITISWMNIDWSPLKEPFQSTRMKNLVGETRSILYVGGDGPNNYSSIQVAINDARSNDTIYVFNGTYYEAVLIDKPLQLLGENKSTTFLDGNGTRDIVTITANYVIVSNFGIQDGHFNILVNHSSDVTISENDIGSGLHGISIQNECSHITISKNSFLENVYGLRIFSSNDVTVSDNNFYSFKINAFYFGTSLSQGRHHWYHNYWETSHYLPYLIHGKIRIGNFSLIMFNIDWTPRSSPYQENSIVKIKYYTQD
jgi:parallel beta-helix repeat protein